MWNVPDIVSLAKQATFVTLRGRPALDDPADRRKLWDIRYTRHGWRAFDRDYEAWLARWEHLWAEFYNGNALDLGCGEGHDARYLTAQGFQVTAVDGSEAALKIARQIASQARHIHTDYRDGLPFANGVFDIIVANLSLHYFDHEQTKHIVHEIERCLAPNGYFFARVNSANDLNFGATGHPEVEPGYYLVNGEYKRFFTRQSLIALGNRHWKLHNMEELTIHRYGSEKVVWEVVVQKLIEKETLWRRSLRWMPRSSMKWFSSATATSTASKS